MSRTRISLFLCFYITIVQGSPPTRTSIQSSTDTGDYDNRTVPTPSISTQEKTTRSDINGTLIHDLKRNPLNKTSSGELQNSPEETSDVHNKTQMGNDHKFSITGSTDISNSKTEVDSNILPNNTQSQDTFGTGAAIWPNRTADRETKDVANISSKQSNLASETAGAEHAASSTNGKDNLTPTSSNNHSQPIGHLEDIPGMNNADSVVNVTSESTMKTSVAGEKGGGTKGSDFTGSSPRDRNQTLVGGDQHGTNTATEGNASLRTEIVYNTSFSQVKTGSAKSTINEEKSEGDSDVVEEHGDGKNLLDTDTAEHEFASINDKSVEDEGQGNSRGEEKKNEQINIYQWSDDGADDDRNNHTENEDKSSSGFFTFILLVMFFTMLLYLFYHNKRKVLAFIRPSNHRKTGSRFRGKYERLQNESGGRL